MKQLINWLKSLFINTKEETKTMTDQVVEVPTEATVQLETQPAVVVADPADEASAGVKDFEAAWEFVETGVAKLGEAAKDELKALAKKYL